MREAKMNLYCIGCGKMFDNVNLPLSPRVYPTCQACATRPEIRNCVELLRQPTVIQQAAPSALVQIDSDFWVDAALVEEITAVLIGQQGERYVRVGFRGGAEYVWTTPEFQSDFRAAQMAAAELRDRVNEARSKRVVEAATHRHENLLRESSHLIRQRLDSRGREPDASIFHGVSGESERIDKFESRKLPVNRRRIFRIRVVNDTIAGFSIEPHPPMPGVAVGRRTEGGFAYIKCEDRSFDPVPEGALIPTYVARNGEWVPVPLNKEGKEVFDASTSAPDTVRDCRACGQALNPENCSTADGCPCNSPRGVNHGLVPTHVCTCEICDPDQTGSVRQAEPKPEIMPRN